MTSVIKGRAKINHLSIYIHIGDNVSVPLWSVGL